MHDIKFLLFVLNIFCIILVIGYIIITFIGNIIKRKKKFKSYVQMIKIIMIKILYSVKDYFKKDTKQDTNDNNKRPKFLG